MDLIDGAIAKYAEDHSTPESPLLQRINRDTHLHVLKPQMLSGHLQGRFLSQISKMICPKNILEIGTYTGYSSICLAEGLQDGGELFTIDKNAELEERVNEYFKDYEEKKTIHFIVGNAKEEIQKLDKIWDLVFIDADKEAYLDYYKMVYNNVRSGGVILVDNVLWYGKVTNAHIEDKTTESIREFNEYVTNDLSNDNVLLPIRDGIMMITKK